jgi:hypothetical protein
MRKCPGMGCAYGRCCESQVGEMSLLLGYLYKEIRIRIEFPNGLTISYET